MSQHDGNHTHYDPMPSDDSIPPRPPIGGALAPLTAGMPVGGPLAQMPMGPRPTDVIRGGMDRSGLFHALRRRWLLATCMGLLLGAASAAGLWIAFPESSTATVQYLVSSENQEVMGGDMGNESRDFEIYRKTQVVQIRSPFVINAVLKDPAVRALKSVAAEPEEDRPEWLLERLTAQFPGDSEVLEIRLTGSEPKEDLAVLAQAVSRAYYEEVVYRAKQKRLLPRTILQQAATKLDAEIRRKSESLLALQQDRGSTDALVFDPRTQMLMTDIKDAQTKKSQAEGALAEARAEFSLIQTMVNDPAYLEAQVDEALAQDPSIANMQQMVMMYDMQIREVRSTTKHGDSPQLRSLEKKRNSIQNEIAQTRSQMKQQFMTRKQTEPDPYLKQATVRFQIALQNYGQQIKQAEEVIAKLKEEVEVLGEKDAELAMRASEVEQLQLVQQSVVDRIERWDIEAEAPDRITPLGGDPNAPPETTDNINFYERTAISTVGGIGAFLLTALGIAYAEFSGRKLNDPDQVEEGLGIRVIGTLPSLSGRKVLSSSSPILAQLQESIDSVRTALMHESTTKRRQIVLVTSPATLEGRTTVASQLAVSLSRAGRRTLLIDGDVRSPSLHTLFDVPLEDGLCEVLRAEVDVSDVVRATNAEGLWLLTGGYCDVDAVHALATDQVQPIIEKLRGDYDFIIIDGAPVIGLSDALLFGQHCDGAILSVLRDQTSVPKIHQAAELLRSVGIRMIGTVVNGVPFKSDRRVMHLQTAAPRSPRKQLEQADA
ncbi:Tyrosine-protein kinase YwqD [Pirellulimonas nuda]|uniref:non-specific protein-tyrosine kinase n=1 Tax=Pirellulimonas nuda TaxID=2528009 RepID=A0A518DJL7_9BACT|nr:polysaccharide biosynthesis tyrosine autokinase [Pirellulimonas nuda]QDU91670.1 Tyrosine-protein kinase YwqD [Pirellulimonas nuda]